jgi:hypothetical protein
MKAIQFEMPNGRQYMIRLPLLAAEARKRGMSQERIQQIAGDPQALRDAVDLLPWDVVHHLREPVEENGMERWRKRWQDAPKTFVDIPDNEPWRGATVPGEPPPI